MVDFKKLRKAKAKPKPTRPRDIFNMLPKPPGINDLYASQAEVLDSWEKRQGDKDVVIKLHTGGGKTLVGLLLAQAVMNKTEEPVLYLAPTKQLVAQVISKSSEYGISTVPYPKGGGQPLPSPFLNGQSVMVATYEALFNGRSKFGVLNGTREIVQLGAIILDDAHVALGSVRSAFTLEISAERHREVYDDLAGRFRPAFHNVGRRGLFADIVSGKENRVVEVPVGAWLDQVDAIQSYLSEEVEAIDEYVWPLLRDILPYCHCLFSRRSVTITPYFPPVDLIPTFNDCPHRIYMSATIADDSEIIRTFNANHSAVGKPLTSTSLAGVGERMILVPELMKLGGEPIRPMMQEIARKVAEAKKGVLVLCPSDVTASAWEEVATHPANSKAVEAAVAELQDDESFGPLVLANRYDGIDLAGDSCRLLIMDDLPQGSSNYDAYRLNVLADTAVSSLLAQRIEQGIGRGTRGGGDHCAVVLMGSQLVAWIGRKRNLDFLTSSTRAQLEIGREISSDVANKKDFINTIKDSLRRDEDWIGYHAEQLAEATHNSAIDELPLTLAGVERKSFQYLRLGQHEKALARVEKLMGDGSLNKEAQRIAWLAAFAARVAMHGGDGEKAQTLQTRAFSINNNHTPPRVRPVYTARPTPGAQAAAIVQKISQFDPKVAILASFDTAVANLTAEASSGQYEAALQELGTYLGFEAERPDTVHQIGPDVLWRTASNFDFIIEAKSEKQSENTLYKKDHAQLLEAEAWFKTNYPDRSSVRVSALPEPIADPKASPQGTLAFRLNSIQNVKSLMRSLLVSLIDFSGDDGAILQRCEDALRAAKLTPEGLRDNHMIPFVAKKSKGSAKA
jgi:replicative superfamily II helicase